MLYVTIVLLGLLAIVSYYIFDKDIFAPPTILTVVFFFSSLCACYNMKTWGLNFSAKTTWLVIIAVSAFLIGGITAVIITCPQGYRKAGYSNSIAPVMGLRIEPIKTVFVIFAQVMVILWLFIELRSLTGERNWIKMVSIYRNQAATADPDEYTMVLPFLLKQLINISFNFALLYAYIVGNNLAARFKQSWINWIPIILSSLTAFLQGYRSDMLRLWIAILIVMYVMNRKATGWQKSKETNKLLRNIIASVVFVAILFVGVREMVGRVTQRSPIEYLTFYAGCPLAALDEFVKKPLPPSDIWGKETFYSLNQGIAVLFNSNKLRYLFFKEFAKSPNGTRIGNVYTAIRPPYYDFGFAGMIVFMILMGIFFTVIYCNIRNRQFKKPIDFSLLLYSYLAYTVFMSFYNLYISFISITFIRTILVLLVGRWYLTGW